MSIFEFPMVFPADGASLVGRVYRNVDDLVTPQPAVVVTGAWLTVKEQMARTYALRLAEQGITAFTFDFTGFGQSGGAPRQLELPARKIADIAAAADFLSTMSFVREGGVGYVGICASAQYALAAIARGARIRSFASIAGWYHDAASVASFYGGAEGARPDRPRARGARDLGDVRRGHHGAAYAPATIAREYSSSWTTTPIRGAARCRSGRTRWRRCRGSSG